MNIAFDRSNSEKAKKLLNRAQLVTELARVRRDLLALGPVETHTAKPDTEAAPEIQDVK